MTRDRMMAAIRAGLKKSAGMDISIAAEKIADSIELAVEMDMDAASMPAPMPTPIRQATAPAKKPILPPSPAIAADMPHSESAPLIIRPDDVGDWEDLAKNQPPARPISVTSLKGAANPSTEGDLVIHWRIEQLIGAVERAAPEKFTIEVEVNDDVKKVVLVRNIVADHGMSAVKLCYAHKSFKQGELEAKHIFYCTDDGLLIDRAMENIHTQAKALYMPRPKVITSSVPIRQGGSMSDLISMRSGVDGGEF